MEVSSHNVRTVMVSADLVGQSIKGEHNQAPAAAPAAIIPEKPGDPKKVVQSKDTYESQNDLERKKRDREQKDKNEEETSSESEQSIEKELKKPVTSNIGRQLDLNA